MLERRHPLGQCLRSTQRLLAAAVCTGVFVCSSSLGQEALRDLGGSEQSQQWVHMAEPEPITPSAARHLELSSQPTDLASGDLNEDGLDDLVVSSTSSRGGLVVVYLGTGATLYPHGSVAPDASSMSLGATISVPSASQIEVGDFDADGHLDVVTGAAGSRTLHFLMGRGDGSFADSEPLSLPGHLTTLLATPLRRLDSLSALIVGVDGPTGPSLLIHESARGARNAQVEVVTLPDAATHLAGSHLDAGPARELVVAAGHHVLVFEGEHMLESEPVRLVLSDRVLSVAVGNFVVGPRTSPQIAALTADGALSLLNRRGGLWTEALTTTDVIAVGEDSIDNDHQADLVRVAHVSSLVGDDLVVVDRSRRQIRVLHAVSEDAGPQLLGLRSLSLSSEPVAALPLRLGPDALHDLVVVEEHRLAPTVASTEPVRTFVVDSEADDSPYDVEAACDAAMAGRCSLRSAIRAANAGPGADAILFAVDSIQITTPLPAIEEALLIDGRSTVDLSCSADACLTLSGRSAVRGLSLRGGDSAAIRVRGRGNVVEGNDLAVGRSRRAVLVEDGSYNRIGGTVAEARNRIGGSHAGVEIAGDSSRHNRVLGNLFTRDAGSAGRGALAAVILRSSHNVVGGAEPGAGNELRFGASGVRVDRAHFNAILGNTIGGPDLLGTGSGTEGVRVGPGATYNAIGGASPGAANRISRYDVGVRVTASSTGGVRSETLGNRIQGNLIGPEGGPGKRCGESQRWRGPRAGSVRQPRRRLGAGREEPDPRQRWPGRAPRRSVGESGVGERHRGQRARWDPDRRGGTRQPDRRWLASGLEHHLRQRRRRCAHRARLGKPGPSQRHLVQSSARNLRRCGSRRCTRSDHT